MLFNVINSTRELLVIKRYNRLQTIKAILLLLGGLFFSWLAYLFFRYLPAFITSQFGYELETPVSIGVGIVGLAAAGFSGYRIWKRRGGLFSYHESGLYHNLGEETAGAFITDYYAHRITGPAYLLGQIFLAGPVWILEAFTLLYGRIKYSADLESRLETTLEVLRAAKKWQGLHDHPNRSVEILYLAQMELIDFSSHKGAPRFKIR